MYDHDIPISLVLNVVLASSLVQLSNLAGCDGTRLGYLAEGKVISLLRHG